MACTKYAVNEEFFESIDTLEKCWALGWFFSDGFNRVYPPDSRITLDSKDEEVLVKLATLIGNTRPLQQEPKYHRVSLIVSRRKFSEDLAKHGCVQAKSLIVEWPHKALDSREKVCAFLRGVLEGDGCIHISRRPGARGPYVQVTIASASSSFVDTLRQIFTEYWGLRGTIMKNATRPVVGIRFDAGRDKMKQMLDEIYNLSLFGSYLERKYQKYLEAKKLLQYLLDTHYQDHKVKPKQPEDGLSVYSATHSPVVLPTSS